MRLEFWLWTSFLCKVGLKLLTKDAGRKFRRILRKLDNTRKGIWIVARLMS